MVAPAAREDGRRRDAVAHLEGVRLVDRDDQARALVAGDERLVARRLVEAVQVGAADRRRLHLHDNFLALRHRVRPVLGHDLVGIQDSCTAHGSLLRRPSVSPKGVQHHSSGRRKAKRISAGGMVIPRLFGGDHAPSMVTPQKDAGMTMPPINRT